MASKNTDLMSALTKKQRVRTMNSRGSMVCTTAIHNETFIKGVANDILYIAPIPTSAVIHDINVTFSADITDEKGVVKVGFAGINKHLENTFTVIKDDVISNVTFGGLQTGHKQFIWTGNVLGKTVYELLCSGDPIKPIAAFEPFSDNENVVLMMTLTTPEDTTSPTDMYIQITYTPGAPSTTSLTKLVLDKE